MKEETKQLIELTRAKITAAQKEIDTKYKDLYDTVKDELAVKDPDYLFEYIFNCDENSRDVYLKFIKDKIFGND